MSLVRFPVAPQKTAIEVILLRFFRVLTGFLYHRPFLTTFLDPQKKHFLSIFQKVAWGRKRVQTCTHAHELLQNDVLFDTVGASFKAYMYPRLFLQVIYQPTFSITPIHTFFYGFPIRKTHPQASVFVYVSMGSLDYGRPASELHGQPQGQSTKH